jgi:hypothetical protein
VRISYDSRTGKLQTEGNVRSMFALALLELVQADLIADMRAAGSTGRILLDPRRLA